MWCISLALSVSCLNIKEKRTTYLIKYIVLYTLFSLYFKQNQAFRILPALLVVLHTLFLIGFMKSLMDFQN